jgi:hypothetical protein
LLLSLGGLTACDNSAQGPSWPLLTDCDLHQQACHQQQDGQYVSLSLNPQPVPIARPINVQVELAGFENVSKIELDIAGINMYMGYNRVNLNSDKADFYTGQTMLAFCTNEVMQWQVTVLVHQQDGQIHQIPYLLETRNR